MTDADVERLLKKAQVLVDAVSFDDNGSLVAGQYVGGNGGLLSKDTIRAADVLRHEIDACRQARSAGSPQ